MTPRKQNKSDIKWSTHFYLERNGRGYVQAGIRGLPIEVHIEMNQDAKVQSRDAGEDYERTCQPDSIWGTEMQRISDQAEEAVRVAWKAWSRR